ncbi:MAG: proton-conducting transporter membrane subunit [Acidobacteriota bacterium]
MIFDSLTLISMALFAGLALVTFASLPKRDRTSSSWASLACIVAGTLLAYSASSLPLFAAGWALTIVPYWVWFKTGPRFALTAGLAALLIGTGIHSLSGATPHIAAFTALMLAALLRKGIFPFHSWVPSGLDQSPILPLGLLLNGHLGAFLLIRFAVPMLPDVAAPAISFVSVLALFTAIYSAVVALGERRPRRVLGFLYVSQVSFILAGLENRNTEGITGALVHWFVVAAATTTLLCAYRALEARCPSVADPAGFLGMANSTPRLAVFFAISGLALVGLPGTLGFAAEDLLFHGSLESHPWLGILLPLATALNGITMYRLFAKLFLGRSLSSTPVVPDVLPRERWALAAAVVFLVGNGMVPGFLVALRSPAAATLSSILSGR